MLWGTGGSPNLSATRGNAVLEPKDPSREMDGRFPAAVLAFVVFASAFSYDQQAHSSLLSLPLLITALLAAVSAWLGIPQLRSLKMGQVIREDGP